MKIYADMVGKSSAWRPTSQSTMGSNETSSQYQEPEEFDSNGARKMSRKVVQQLLRSASGTFITPQYNSSLYLNSKGQGNL